ncbi:MAG: response regulator [Anaerolineae bacterium]
MILKGKKIFLVEDDPVNLAIIRVTLQKQGAVVPFDHWGDSTLERLSAQANTIDLILLDIMLPGNVTGYDIFDQIKNEDSLKDKPIIAVTASDPNLEVPKARLKGFDGYISKPINRQRITKDILSVIEGGEIWPD